MRKIRRSMPSPDAISLLPRHRKFPFIHPFAVFPPAIASIVLLAAILLACFSSVISAQDQPSHAPVILISIDGLRPDYVLEADAHGLKIPNLRRFLSEGAYSTGVHGVVPTVTYPSHTTLVTGVSPARHGIYSNTTFDPLRKNFGGWYWYAEDIKVATLWDAAAAAHRTTANVHWPVSVGAHITWNLPQYWRSGSEDDRKLLRAIATPGLLQTLEKELGPYADGIDESIIGDENRARFAARLIELKHADFTTVYLTALDHEQHHSGPFSPESLSTLERIDAALGLLLNSIQRTYQGRAVVCVVSDHGFVPVGKTVNLAIPFRQAGLIELDDQLHVRSWKATLWAAGGSAAVILKDKADAAAKSQVSALLTGLAADPANGIDRILASDELRVREGFPDAAFLIAFKPGWTIGENLSGDLITIPSYKGMHGYWPDLRDMNSAFFLIGPGVSAHSLGEIDMRAIAPTLALYLGAALPSAESQPLRLKQSRPIYRPTTSRGQNSFDFVLGGPSGPSAPHAALCQCHRPFRVRLWPFCIRLDLPPPQSP